MIDDNLVPIGTLVQTYKSGLFEVVGYEDRYHSIHSNNRNFMLPSTSQYADLNKPPVTFYKLQKRYNVHFHPMNGKQIDIQAKVYPIGDLLESALKKHTKSLENINKLIELNKSQQF